VNLHGMAAPYVAVINPHTVATLYKNTGYITGLDGKQSPEYASSAMMIQVQSLTETDLRQLDNMNVSGSTHTIYLMGVVQTVMRADGQGGDFLTFPSPSALGGPLRTWLVTAVLEQWPDWVKVAVALQNDKRT